MDVQVAVIGGGPSGLSLIAELAHLGLGEKDQVLLIDANRIPCGGSRLPKGQGINQRSMELWERWGKGKGEKSVPERIQALRTVSKEVDPKIVNWDSETKTAQVGQMQNTTSSKSNLESAFVQQPLYEQVLRDFVGEIGDPRNVQTLFGFNVDQISRDSANDVWLIDVSPSQSYKPHYSDLGLDGLHEESGEDEAKEPTLSDAFQVRAKYLVGCDGGRSMVRHSLGIRLQGRGALAASCTVMFHSSSFYQAAQKQFGGLRPGLLNFFNKSPAHPVAMFSFFEGEDGITGTIVYESRDDIPSALLQQPNKVDSPEAYTAYVETCIEEFRACVDLPAEAFADVRPMEAFLWVPYSLCAQTWVQDNAILAGDAAHLLSPAGGLGMNGGVCDAIALAQRLALKLRGAEVDFATYEAERKGDWQRYNAFTVHALESNKTKNRPDADEYEYTIFGPGLFKPVPGQRAPFDASLFRSLSTQGFSLVVTDPDLDEEDSLFSSFKDLARERLKAAETKVVFAPELQNLYGSSLNIVAPNFVLVWTGTPEMLRTAIHDDKLAVF